jgi:TetR/AcrR family transcriptional regulator, transcriptional repressor for nem operon
VAVLEPPTARGRATRERILEVAARLVVARGAGATSLDDVRAQAGVSKSQLYHYFADKDDLVDAVIERTVQAVLDRQPHLADLSRWKLIRRWFAELVALEAEQPGTAWPIGGLASELAGRREGARDALAGGFDRWEAPLHAGLAALQRRGKLRRDADPARLAAATMAAIQGGLLLAQVRRDPEQLRIALDGAYGYLRSFAD